MCEDPAMTRVFVLVGMLASLLVVSVPGAVAVPTVEPVTPTGWDSRTWAQDTDAQGDTAYAFAAGQGGVGSLFLRIRRADGSLTPVVELAPTQGFAQLLVSVDRDGDGAVVWTEGIPEGEPAWRLNARRFTKTGRLGPLLDLAPGQDPTGPAVGARPDGTVVVAWSDNTKDPVTGYVPYVRTIGTDGSLGPVRRLGNGPNSGPLLAVAPDGETVLVWNELHGLKSRRLTSSGRLTPTRRIYRWDGLDEVGSLDGLGVDRQGVATLVFGRWRPLPDPPITDPGARHERGSYLRIAPSSRPIGKPRFFFPITVTYDDLSVGVAVGGTTIIGWQENYYEGAWVRRLSADGALGRTVEIADGGLDDILLRGDGDGIITASGHDDVLYWRIVRVARVVDGRARKSRRVALAGEWDASVVRGALLPGGRWTASWVRGPEPAQVMVATGG
jgi:hypothetical protein